ncbi:MAG: hypothetical protein IJ038_05815 [Clostridia bacterium]|nr:hypothetical protein [Clostridia bacterium]
MLKKKEFWISAAVFVLAYSALEFMTYDWDWSWFPYVHAFNVPTVASWCHALYFIIGKKLTPKTSVICALSVLACALPHVLFTVLVYSSWVCVGVSALFIIFLFVKAHKLKKG